MGASTATLLALPIGAMCFSGARAIKTWSKESRLNWREYLPSIMGFATGIMLLLSDNRPVWIIPPLLLGLWIQMENASRLNADIALIIDSARHQLITYILISVKSEERRVGKESVSKV